MRRPGILTRNSLVQRFFLVFLLVIAVPVVVLGIAVTVGYRKFSLDLASGRINQALSRLSESIDEEVRRTTLLTATLSTDKRFSAAGERFAQSTTPKESYETSQLIEDRLSSFLNYTNKVGAVALYMRGLPVVLYRNNGQLFERPMTRGAWFQAATAQPDSTVILDLALKAFYPMKPPFPLMHIDTGVGADGKLPEFADENLPVPVQE